MNKQKFGKKDIFAPVVKKEKEEVRVSDQSVVTATSSEKPKKKTIKKPALSDPPKPRMVVHSVRMREDLLEKMKAYAFFERTKIYKIVNHAVDEFLKDYGLEDAHPSHKR